MIKNLIANWKTTSAGLTMIVGSAVHLVFSVKSGSANENTWTIALTAMIGGIGLLLAGDASVSVQKTDSGMVETQTNAGIKQDNKL
jgi:hypothetical protein